jgi:molecular chaperone Hsp33
VATVPDLLIKATAAQGQVRGVFVRATRTAEAARRRHRAYPVAAAALGRTLTAALILAATLKAGEHVTVRVLGDGPLGAIVADADGHGHVRGYVQQPHVLLPLRPDGKLDVARAVGQGLFAVSRELHVGQPYSSSVRLVSGEIGLDFAHYLRESEQIPSAVSLGVRISPRGAVRAAGGILLQLLPGGEGLAETLSRRLEAFGPVSAAVAQGMGPREMADALLGDLAPRVLEERPVSFRCPCSRARSVSALLALGEDELRQLVADGEGAEVRCHFCNQTYHIPAPELRRLLERSQGARGG